MNFNKLSEWCLVHRELPDDPNQPFVGSYQIKIDGDDPENHLDEIKQVPNSTASLRMFILTLKNPHSLNLLTNSRFKKNPKWLLSNHGRNRKWILFGYIVIISV